MESMRTFFHFRDAAHLMTMRHRLEGVVPPWEALDDDGEELEDDEDD